MIALIFLLLSFILYPLSLAHGAVAFVSGDSANDGAVSSIAFSFDATGANFLLACHGARDNPTVSTHTYGGVALTLVASQIVERVDDTVYDVIRMYRLVSPASGSNTLSLAFTGASDGIILGVMAFSGVDTTTPLGTAASAEAGGNGVAANTISVSPASTTSDLVAACFGAFGGLSGDETLSLGAGQTLAWTDTRVGSNPQANGSYKTGAAGATAVSGDTVYLWLGMIGVAIKPTAAPSGVARRRIINQ